MPIGIVDDTELLDFEDWVKNVDFMLAGPFFATDPFFGSIECGIADSRDEASLCFSLRPFAGRFNIMMVAQSEVAYPRDRSRLVVFDCSHNRASRAQE